MDKKEAAIKNAQCVLADIADTALRTEQLFNKIVQAGAEDDTDSMIEFALVGKKIANQMGWMADVINGDLDGGTGPSVFDTEGWLLPKDYKDLSLFKEVGNG